MQEGIFMTIKELYDKAVEFGIEDYELWIA